MGDIQHQLNALTETVVKMDTKMDAFQADMTEVKTRILGRPEEPEKSLTARLAQVESKVSRMVWAILTIGGGLLTAFGNKLASWFEVPHK